jgi:hypothetical protein
MKPDFETILQLVKQSGSPFLWSFGDNSYVTMDVQQYQALLADSSTGNAPVHQLSEDELIGKINNDIAQWRQNQVEQEIDLPSSGQDLTIEDDATSDADLQEDQYYLEPVE